MTKLTPEQADCFGNYMSEYKPSKEEIRDVLMGKDEFILLKDQKTVEIPLEVGMSIANELDDLRAKLDTNTKIVNEYQNIIIPGYRERSERVEQERDNLQAQVNSLKTTLEHCDLARDKWLNKYVDLQAANAVLRGVLRGALEYYKTHEDGGVRAVQAISTTPDEAGERVKNLVCALAECLAFIDQLKEHGITEWTGEQAAKDALAKYRGGAE